MFPRAILQELAMLCMNDFDSGIVLHMRGRLLSIYAKNSFKTRFGNLGKDFGHDLA